MGARCMGDSQCTVCNPTPLKPSRGLGYWIPLVTVVTGASLATWGIWEAWGHLAGMGAGVVLAAYVSTYATK